MTLGGSRDPGGGAPATDAEVTSRDRGHLAALWFSTVVWIVLSAPLAWFALPDAWERGAPSAWLLLVFFLVGVWLLVRAVRRTLSWRRFGDLTLRLDPAPGSVGGHVGGEVRVPVRSYGRSDYDVTLSCIRVERRGDGGARSWESVLWTRTRTPELQPEAGGVRLRFTFEVPRELPESGDGDREEGEHRWTLRLTGRVPGLDLDAVFELPVRRHPEPRRAAAPALVEGDAEDRRGFPHRVVRTEPVRQGLRLHFPPGRDPRTGTLLLVFGLVFGGLPLGFLGGVPGDLAGQSGGGGLVVLVFGGAILAVFVLVGAVLTALGVYTLSNSLTVTLGPETITSVRRVLGVPFRGSAAVDDVERVELSIHGQVGQGARARPRFDVRAFVADGRRLVLGDGIPGPELAEGIARLVERKTGLNVERVPRDERTSSLAALRRGGETGPGAG